MLLPRIVLRCPVLSLLTSRDHAAIYVGLCGQSTFGAWHILAPLVQLSRAIHCPRQRLKERFHFVMVIAPVEKLSMQIHARMNRKRLEKMKYQICAERA